MVRKMKKKVMISAVIAVMLGLGFVAASSFEKAITVFSNHDLVGITVVIDAGHGGVDPGSSRGNVIEDEINLSIAKLLEKILKESGAEVIMIRDEDEDLSEQGASSKKQSDLKARVEIMNQENVTFFISLHGNISLDTKVKGAQVYYQSGNEPSRILAECVQQALKSTTSSKFIIKKGDYYILNNTSNPGILVEYGFLSNAAEREKLKDAKYQEAIAYNIYEGILEYLKKIKINL